MSCHRFYTLEVRLLCYTASTLQNVSRRNRTCCKRTLNQVLATSTYDLSTNHHRDLHLYERGGQADGEEGGRRAKNNLSELGIQKTTTLYKKVGQHMSEPHASKERRIEQHGKQMIGQLGKGGRTATLTLHNTYSPIVVHFCARNLRRYSMS